MLAIAIGSAWGAGTFLPFNDGFEGGTATADITTNDWYSKTTGSATYDNSQTTVDGSDQTAYITDDLSFLVDAATYNYTNVWCTFYTKVTPQSSSPGSLDGNTEAAFYVNSSGEVVAYDGASGWSTVATGVATSPWMGFAVHLDYSADKWDIYKTPTGFSYGDILEQLNTAAALGFNPSADKDEFESMAVEGTTYLDGLNFNFGNAEVDNDSPSNAVNAAIEIVIGEELTGVLVKYFAPGDCTLDGPLGEALSLALVAGDQIHIFDPSDGTWDDYTCDGEGSWTEAHAGVTITPTPAIYVSYNGSGTREPFRATAYKDLQVAQDTTVDVIGTAQNRWTPLAVPFTASAHAVFSGGNDPLNLATPADVGDIIILRSGRTLWWDGSNWRDGGALASGITVRRGEGFWFGRFSGQASTTWDPTGL